MTADVGSDFRVMRAGGCYMASSTWTVIGVAAGSAGGLAVHASAAYARHMSPARIVLILALALLVVAVAARVLSVW